MRVKSSVGFMLRRTEFFRALVLFEVLRPSSESSFISSPSPKIYNIFSSPVSENLESIAFPLKTINTGISSSPSR